MQQQQKKNLEYRLHLKHFYDFDCRLDWNDELISLYKHTYSSIF